MEGVNHSKATTAFKAILSKKAGKREISIKPIQTNSLHISKILTLDDAAAWEDNVSLSN